MDAIKLKTCIILITLLGSGFYVSGQEITKLWPDLEGLIENLTEQTETSYDWSGIITDLQYLEENPIPINHATRDDLSTIFFLNAMQITNLISYIQHTGSITSIYEMQMIEGFDQQLIKALTPFITLTKEAYTPRITRKNLAQYTHHQLITRISRTVEKKKGYQTDTSGVSNYAGGAESVYFRYRATYYNKLALSILAEKDPGEQYIIKTPRSAPAHHSVGFEYSPDKAVQKIILGDYHIAAGNGLTFSSAASFASAATPSSIVKHNSLIRINTSASETDFLRGGAMLFKLQSWQLLLFGSYTHPDATLQTDTLNNEYISSLSGNGLHRTQKELSRRRLLNRTLVGGRIIHRRGRLKTAFTAYHQKYDRPIEKNDALYAKYRFHGKEGHAIGSDISWASGKLGVSAEITMDNSNNIAYIAHLHALLPAGGQLFINTRSYPVQYSNPMGKAYGTMSTNSNETGLYTALKYELSAKAELTAASDITRHRWISYQCNSPSSTHTLYLQGKYHMNRNHTLTIQYRSKSQDKNETENNPGLHATYKKTRQTMRLHLRSEIAEGLLLDSRMEYSQYTFDKISTEGVLFLQDVTYYAPSGRWQLSVRYALFDTEDYNTRIYAYERDVLYKFSSIALQNNGLRSYLVARYKIAPRTDIWLKLSRTKFYNQISTGSGNETINTPYKHDITIQLNLRL